MWGEKSVNQKEGKKIRVKEKRGEKSEKKRNKKEVKRKGVIKDIRGKTGKISENNLKEKKGKISG